MDLQTIDTAMLQGNTQVCEHSLHPQASSQIKDFKPWAQPNTFIN